MIEESAVDIDLLSSEAWPSREVARGGKSIRGPHLHTLLGTLSALRGSVVDGDIDKTLGQAISELNALPPDCRLTDPKAKSANEKIKHLVMSLEAKLLESGENKPAQAFIDSYRNPSHVVTDLVQLCCDFAAQTALEKRDKAATFSMILFRSSDHGGKLRQSFDSDQNAWANSLKPEDGSIDPHLAVIPPSDAAVAIEKLAAQLGIRDKLPCIFFLGGSIPINKDHPLLLNKYPTISNVSAPPLASWTCFTLHQEPPTYPDQLRKIYKTVYDPNALLPGERITVAADFLKEKALEKINPVAVGKILVGALLGPGAGAALEAGLKIFSK